MMNFLSSTEINDLVLKNVNKDIYYRSGIDYRFTDETGKSIEGHLRNRKVTLDYLLGQLNHYYIELEKDECTDDKLVFHGYSSNDME